MFRIIVKDEVEEDVRKCLERRSAVENRIRSLLICIPRISGSLQYSLHFSVEAELYLSLSLNSSGSNFEIALELKFISNQDWQLEIIISLCLLVFCLFLQALF